MKRLVDYIFENLEESRIDEGFSSNWKHYHEGDYYYYPKKVIDDLFQNKSIQIGDITSSKKFKPSNDVITLDMFDQNELKSIRDDLDHNQSNTSAERFNKAFKNDKIKTNRIWYFIDRAQYSKGSSDGGNAEIVVCNSFNNNLSDEEIINYANKYQISGKTWLASIKNTLNILSKKGWKNNEYVAIQVDGKGYDDIKNTGKLSKDELKKIAFAYSDKKEIAQLFNINIDKLYPKNSKDAWNKADILLVKKDYNTYNLLAKKINELLKDNNNADQSIGYNAILVELTTSGYIIPISLKKVPDSNASLYSHNLDEQEKSLAIEHEYADIELPATELKGDNEKDNKNGSLYLILNNGKDQPNKVGSNKWKKGKNLVDIQFYKRASSSNLKPTAKIELVLKNSKGGSGYLQICSALNTTTDEINNIMKISNKENMEKLVKEGVQTYFGWDINNLPTVVKSAKNWYMKPCFVCLIALLNKYCEHFKIKKNKEVLLQFANFAIGACEGNGSYYIIK